MDQFEQPSAKLLYMVNEMFKLKLITPQEKLTLKDYVLQEKPEVYQLIQKYPSSEQEINIADALVDLLRGAQQQAQSIKPEEEEEDYQKNVVLPEEASSPLGNQLMRRKKAKQSNIQEIKGLLLSNKFDEQK